MGKMTWDDFMDRVTAGDIVGGDVETVEDGVRHFRSRIGGVYMADGQLSIRCVWTAMERPDGKWGRVPTGGVGFDTSAVRPEDAGMGRIEIQIPYLGEALIYPRGDEPLDLADVLPMEDLHA